MMDVMHGIGLPLIRYLTSWKQMSALIISKGPSQVAGGRLITLGPFHQEQAALPSLR